jgi:hypothetical protein
MFQRTFQSLVIVATLMGSTGVASAAGLPNRDTGVGHDIAMQGNLAIQLIQAEFKAAMHLLKPMLPKGHITKVSTPASNGDGATFVAATSVRCAE